MKTSIVALCVLSAPAFAAGVQAASDSSHLEKQADKQTLFAKAAAARGEVDAPIFDDVGDGAIWVRGRNYKARVSSDGMSFIPFLGSRAPRDFPVDFHVASAAIGAQALALSFDAKPVRDQQRVYVEHGSVTEIYDFSADSVEQSFTVRRGNAVGDLSVRCAVASPMKRGVNASGIRFSTAVGGVRCGWARSVDASGREVSTASLPLAEGLEFVVPADELQRAFGDITIDPIIASTSVDTSSINDHDPDVAYDAANDVFLVAYEEDYSQTDHDVRCQLVSGSTGLVVPGMSSYIDITTASWRQVAVANAARTTTFLAVASVGPKPEQIMCRTRAAQSTSMGVQALLSTYDQGNLGQVGACPPPTNWPWMRRNVAPTVSGNSDPTSDLPFRVAWICNMVTLMHNWAINEDVVCSQVHIMGVTNTGAPAGGSFPLPDIASNSYPWTIWAEPSLESVFPKIADGTQASLRYAKDILPTVLSNHPEPCALLAWKRPIFNLTDATQTEPDVIRGCLIDAGSNGIAVPHPLVTLADLESPIAGLGQGPTVASGLSVSSVRFGKAGLQTLIAFDAIGPSGTSRLYGALVDPSTLGGSPAVPNIHYYDLTKLQEKSGTTLVQSMPSVDSDGSRFAITFNTFSNGSFAMACAEFAFQNFYAQEFIYCDEFPTVIATQSTPMGPFRCCSEKSGGGTRPYTLFAGTKFGGAPLNFDPFVSLHTH